MNKDKRVRVALRVRSLPDAKSVTCLKKVASEPKVIWNENKTFEFDCVFDENTTQTQIYASLVQKLLVDLLNGYSATVLVYGPNGCGKTYTLGSNSAAITSLTNSRVTTITKRPQLNDFDGVLPRVLDDLISFIDYEQQQSQQSQHRPEYENDDDDDDNDEKEEEEEDADKETPTLSVKLSLFELYQKEIVKDLFVNRLYASSSQSSTDSSLLVVTNTAVPSPPPRLPHRTEFTISLEQPPVRHNRRQPNGSLDLVKSQLRFIKVAGWVKSSKVSRFLHDALLETDSNVILIACVNPAEAHMTETLNMLDWAADVMKINKTTKECVAKKDNERELNELRAQVEELKAQVAKLTCEAKSGHIESPGSCDEKLMKHQNARPLNEQRLLEGLTRVACERMSVLESEKDEQMHRLDEIKEIFERLLPSVDELKCKIDWLEKENDELVENVSNADI